MYSLNKCMLTTGNCVSSLGQASYVHRSNFSVIFERSCTSLIIKQECSGTGCMHLKWTKCSFRSFFEHQRAQCCQLACIKSANLLFNYTLVWEPSLCSNFLPRAVRAPTCFSAVKKLISFLSIQYLEMENKNLTIMELEAFIHFNPSLFKRSLRT